MSDFFAHYDGALIALYIFWAAFALLIVYLRNEDRREGYPLVHEVRDGALKVVFPKGGTPSKTFNLVHGGPTVAAHEERDVSALLGRTGYTPGSPFLATGDAMKDGVGTASWAMRADVPDLTFDGALPKIVPLRADPDHHIAEEDSDPRGWSVVTTDGQQVGTISDLWVDRSEVLLRYFEATVEGVSGVRSVVFPIGFGELDTKRKLVRVPAVTAPQFLDAPMLKNADSITLREEDQVSGYFAGGYLYAVPGRAEPCL